MNTLLYPNKPEPTKKIHFEILVNQSELHLLDNSRCQNFDERIKKMISHTSCTLYLCGFQIRILFEKNQYSNSSYGEEPFEYRVKWILNYIFRIFAPSVLWQFLLLLLYNYKVPDAYLVGIKSLWWWRSLTLGNEIDKSENHLKDVSQSQIFNAGVKNYDFPVPSYAIRVMFPIEISFGQTQNSACSYLDIYH